MYMNSSRCSGTLVSLTVCGGGEGWVTDLVRDFNYSQPPSLGTSISYTIVLTNVLASGRFRGRCVYFSWILLHLATLLGHWNWSSSLHFVFLKVFGGTPLICLCFYAIIY